MGLLVKLFIEDSRKELHVIVKDSNNDCDNEFNNVKKADRCKTHLDLIVPLALREERSSNDNDDDNDNDNDIDLYGNNDLLENYDDDDDDDDGNNSAAENGNLHLVPTTAQCNAVENIDLDIEHIDEEKAIDNAVAAEDADDDDNYCCNLSEASSARFNYTSNKPSDIVPITFTDATDRNTRASTSTNNNIDPRHDQSNTNTNTNTNTNEKQNRRRENDEEEFVRNRVYRLSPVDDNNDDDDDDDDDTDEERMVRVITTSDGNDDDDDDDDNIRVRIDNESRLSKSSSKKVIDLTTQREPSSSAAKLTTTVENESERENKYADNTSTTHTDPHNTSIYEYETRNNDMVQHRNDLVLFANPDNDYILNDDDYEDNVEIDPTEIDDHLRITDDEDPLAERNNTVENAIFNVDGSCSDDDCYETILIDEWTPPVVDLTTANDWRREHRRCPNLIFECVDLTTNRKQESSSPSSSSRKKRPRPTQWDLVTVPDNEYGDDNSDGCVRQQSSKNSRLVSNRDGEEVETSYDTSARSFDDVVHDVRNFYVDNNREEIAENQRRLLSFEPRYSPPRPVSMFSPRQYSPMSTGRFGRGGSIRPISQMSTYSEYRRTSLPPWQRRATASRGSYYSNRRRNNANSRNIRRTSFTRHHRPYQRANTSIVNTI